MIIFRLHYLHILRKNISFCLQLIYGGEYPYPIDTDHYAVFNHKKMLNAPQACWLIWYQRWATTQSCNSAVNVAFRLSQFTSSDFPRYLLIGQLGRGNIKVGWSPTGWTEDWTHWFMALPWMKVKEDMNATIHAWYLFRWVADTNEPHCALLKNLKWLWATVILP